MSEATTRVFRHTAVQNIFGNTSGRVLMLVMTACGNFVDFLVDIYEIFNINNSSNLDYLMWFKEAISLNDSNFDMENYSSLVDVKLLLKRILDGYWNKLLCKKIIESKVQLAPPTKNVIMAVLTPKSVIQLTAFKAFETGRKLNSGCCIPTFKL